MQVPKMILVLIILFSLLTLALDVPKITREYTTLKKVGNSVIKYAEKKGGFQGQAVTLFNSLLKRYKLESAVKDVEFTPGVDVNVQKRGKFMMDFTYKATYIIPFAGTKTFELPMHFDGYSHKYFKP